MNVQDWDSADENRANEVGLMDRHNLAAQQLIDEAQRASSIRRPNTRSQEPRPLRLGDSFPPEVHHDELDAKQLVLGVTTRGALLVRDFLQADSVNSLAQGIDRTFDAFDGWIREPNSTRFGPWFEPFKPEELDVHMSRPALRAGGGIFTADSPRIFAQWARIVHASGLFDLIAEVFGEPPITSLTKGTLRRVRAGDGIEWHQDGAFLGVDSGAINVWVSLSDTSSSPGLEIVSRRFGGIAETGTHGAGYDWSVGDGLVDDLARDTPVVCPRFAPGDALIFDGLLLHRTAQESPARPGVRYAIETWFFRPSSFPGHQRVPIAF